MRNYIFFGLVLGSAILATWTFSQNYFEYKLMVEKQGTIEARDFSSNIQLISNEVFMPPTCESNKRTWKDAVQMVRNHRNNCYGVSSDMRSRRDAIYVEFEATTLACFLDDIKNNSSSKNLEKCHVRIYQCDYSSKLGADCEYAPYLNRSTLLLVGAEGTSADAAVYTEFSMDAADKFGFIIGTGDGDASKEARYNHGTLCPPDCGTGMSGDSKKGALLAKAVYANDLNCFSGTSATPCP